MMQEYDITVKSLSDFEILNQVSLLVSCLKFVSHFNILVLSYMLPNHHTLIIFAERERHNYHV